MTITLFLRLYTALHDIHHKFWQKVHWSHKRLQTCCPLTPAETWNGQSDILRTIRTRLTHLKYGNWGRPMNLTGLNSQNNSRRLQTTANYRTYLAPHNQWAMSQRPVTYSHLLTSLKRKVKSSSVSGSTRKPSNLEDAITTEDECITAEEVNELHMRTNLTWMASYLG